MIDLKKIGNHFVWQMNCNQCGKTLDKVIPIGEIKPTDKLEKFALTRGWKTILDNTNLKDICPKCKRKK